MSNLINGKLPCPWCHSSDAFHEYEDNYYCFSCHKYEWKNKTKKSFPVKESSAPKEAPNNKIELPKDFTYDIPNDIKAKLYLQHFTDELLRKFGVGFSENCWIWSHKLNKYFNSGSRLILPYYSFPETTNGHVAASKLLFYEAKTYDKTNKLKYISVGGKQILYKTFVGSVSKVILVEDILSAIRIGKWFPCIALRGTFLSEKKTISLLNSVTDTAILWLDGDKPGVQATRKLTRKLRLVRKVINIHTLKDPKCYSDEDILALLDLTEIQNNYEEDSEHLQPK